MFDRALNTTRNIDLCVNAFLAYWKMLNQKGTWVWTGLHEINGVNSFLISVPILYPLKTPENLNLSFSGVFRR